MIFWIYIQEKCVHTNHEEEARVKIMRRKMVYVKRRMSNVERSTSREYDR